MDLGLHYANFSHPDWQHRLTDRLTATARLADEGGVAQFTVMDHYFQMEMLGGPPEPMLEGYTTLGYLAAVTERIDLGLLVTGVSYRHPGLLAKIVTTLDVLSGGRAFLGIGAAWYEREHEGLGVPFPTMSERYERLEETLRIFRQMTGPDGGSFTGEHFHLAETVNVPPPVREAIPVMIGGSGEKKTLRLVAEYANACNLFGEGPEVVRRKLDVLRAHCDDVGRDYAAIRKTVLVQTDPVADPDGFLGEMETLAGLGVEMAVTMPPTDDPESWTGTVVEQVLPRLREL